MMKIDESKHGKAVVFSLEGRFDSTTSIELEKRILETINAGNHFIILDCSLVNYISSAGIRVLVRSHKELEKLHGKILLSSLPKPIENILYITGFLPYFQVFEDLSQALSSLQQPIL